MLRRIAWTAEAEEIAKLMRTSIVKLLEKPEQIVKLERTEKLERMATMEMIHGIPGLSGTTSFNRICWKLDHLSVSWTDAVLLGGRRGRRADAADGAGL